MLFVLDGPASSSASSPRSDLDRMKAVVSLNDPSEPDVQRYGFDTIGAMDRALADEWAAKIVHHLESAAVLVPYQDVRLSPIVQRRMSKFFLSDAAACLKLLRVIDTDTTRPVVIASESRRRRALFSRLLADRGVSYSLLRQHGHLKANVIQNVKPALLISQDVARFLVGRLTRSEGRRANRRAMIAFPSPPTRVRTLRVR